MCIRISFYFHVIKQTQVGGYSYSVSIHVLFNFVGRYIELEIETWSNMASRGDILHITSVSVPVHDEQCSRKSDISCIL